MIPWNEIKKDYVQGIEKDGKRTYPTIRELCDKYKVQLSTVGAKAKKEKWVVERNDLKKIIETKDQDNFAENISSKFVDMSINGVEFLNIASKKLNQAALLITEKTEGNVEKLKILLEAYSVLFQLKDQILGYKTDIENKERITIQGYKRRSKVEIDGNCLTSQDWIEIQAKQDYKCIHCGKIKVLEKDHIVPISKGGKHNKENIQGLCRSCNSKKSNKIESIAFESYMRGN